MPWPLWLSWLEHRPVHRKVGDSIPGQGTCLGYRFNPLTVRVHMGGNQWLFLRHIGVSLSLSLPLSKISKHVLYCQVVKLIPYIGYKGRQLSVLQ